MRPPYKVGYQHRRKRHNTRVVIHSTQSRYVAKHEEQGVSGGYLALLDDTASTCRCHGGLQLLMLPHKLLTVAPLLRT